MGDFGRFERLSGPDSTEPDRISLTFNGARVSYDWREQLGHVDLDEWQSQFHRLIRAQARMFDALLAGAIEAARLSETCGVLVDGMTIRITQEVPYGEVHYAPYGPGADLI